MNVIQQYKLDKVKIKNLKLDIETYENDYLGLGDTPERWNTLNQLKEDFEIINKFIIEFEKALSSLGKEEYQFIKSVYWDDKPYNEFAFDLFHIDIAIQSMNKFCGFYKKYVIKKLERTIKLENYRNS